MEHSTISCNSAGGRPDVDLWLEGVHSKNGINNASILTYTPCEEIPKREAGTTENNDD